MNTKAVPAPEVEGRVPSPRRHPVVGNLPPRNPAFTGRERWLSIMDTTFREPVSDGLCALHGEVGVGKTQLATEYAHRRQDGYDIVWWIPAEEPARIRDSLVELGKAAGLRVDVDATQTVALVLETLRTSEGRWLLVYDNLDRRSDIDGLVPPTGTGDVIITSRNSAEWATSAGAIEVDVFERPESIELIRHYGGTTSIDDAGLLAGSLGDLPLAVEHAAAWLANTGIPVSQYVEEFDRMVGQGPREGRPADHARTIRGLTKVALNRLRADAPATAELLELFACLGPEPISVDTLRRGTLRRATDLDHDARRLSRIALVKVETQARRIRIRAPFQRALLEVLEPDRLNQARSNAQRLLAAANPGFPDDPGTWPLHAEVGSHILAADLINAPEYDARVAVVDQIRYRFDIGDYEASLALGEAALAAWLTSRDPALGPDQELALLARRLVANTLRLLGETKRARELNRETLELLRNSPHFGEDHEHTLCTANGLGVDLRIEGRFAEALDIEEANVQRHARVFRGDEDDSTLRALNNLATSLRHLGLFHRALEIDTQLVERCHRLRSRNDPRTLAAELNLAIDLYGLGDYRAILERQRETPAALRERLPSSHRWVLLGERVVAIALRKSGFLDEARELSRDNYRGFEARFGRGHEYTLAASMSYANALRGCGEVGAARDLMRASVDLYQEVFGEAHPFTLAAMVNFAIALRAADHHQEAFTMDSFAFDALSAALGPKHPYSLAAANGWAKDLALAGKLAEARQLSERTHAMAREVRGEAHPETLAYAINLAFARQAAGEGDTLDPQLARLREALGTGHPDAVGARRGVRVECDIELPPS